MTEETVTPAETGDAIPEGEAAVPEGAEPKLDADTPKEEETPKEEIEADETAQKELAKKSYEKREQRRLKKQNQRLAESNKQISEKLDRLEKMMEKSNQPGAPKLGDFNTVEEFVTAALKHDRQVNQTKPEPVNTDDFSEINENLDLLMEIGSEKYDDFIEVVQGEAPITEVMRDAIFDTENQADIAYYLGKNPKEAARISRMSPQRQYIEIGKLDGRDFTPVKPKKPSAPAPITPIEGGATQTDGFKEGMSDSAFEKSWRKMRGRQ